MKEDVATARAELKKFFDAAGDTLGSDFDIHSHAPELRRCKLAYMALSTACTSFSLWPTLKLVRNRDGLERLSTAFLDVVENQAQ